MREFTCDDDWVIARELDSDSEISNREREVDLSAFWLIWLFWFELTMTVTLSSRAASLKNPSRLDLLFTSLSVWLVYLHILTNSCKSVALYDSIAKAFCNSYNILFLRSSSNASWLYSSESLVNRWNSVQNVLKFLNDLTCLRRLYAFNALVQRFESSKIRYKSSKIFFEMMYDLIEFLKNREIRCFMTSSLILIRTYTFCCTSVRNQFAFSFNLFCMTDNQSSMMRSLSSIKIDESDNFLDVKTITSSSMMSKSVFEFFTFFSRNSIFNSRIVSMTSCSLFAWSLYFSVNSFIFFTFSFNWRKKKTCSFRIFFHAVAIEISFFFNQYFIWSRFWMWYEIEAASDSSSISSVEITDSRRIFLIDRFNDSDSIDSIDCLSLETIFSWIMILLQMIYADTTRIDACLMLDFLLDWFKIT